MLIKRLTRLTLCLFLTISLFNIKPVTFAKTSLKDISGHEWEYEIIKLVESDIVKGYPDGTFRPEVPITRAEAVVLIVSSKNLSLIKSAINPFRDVPINHFAFAQIATAHKAGIIKGYPDGTFRPSANITRCELAVLLGQMKGLAGEAVKISVPVTLAQDEASIPRWADGWITLGLRSQHQYLSYRSVDGFRLIAPQALATRAETAYGLHQVLYPPKMGGTVNIGMFTEPDTMNMFVGPTVMAWVPFSLLNIPTVGRDHNWSLYPGTLQVIPTVENGLWKVVGDKMEITYLLRQGLKWQDGKPVTLNDWAYTLQVFMDPLVPSVRTVEDKIDFTKGAGAYHIKGFDILTSDSVKVYFKELDFRANLWMPGSMELTGFYPQHILEKPYTEMKSQQKSEIFIKDEILARKPIGLGPYKIREWIPATRMSLEKNSDFFFGLPLIDNIVIRFIPDTTSLLARVISGKDIDITPGGISLSQGLSLATRPPENLKVNFVGGLAFSHIAFNLDNPILSDLRVRKALMHSIDRETISQSLFQGKQPVAHTIFASGHWASDNTNIIKYSYNQTEARKLLDEAGWKSGTDGFRYKNNEKLALELRTTSGNREREDVQSIIQKQLKEVGIDLDISKNLPSAVFLGTEHFVMRKWPSMILFSWNFGPTSIADSIYRGDMIPKPENNWTGWNIYGWNNSEATELLKKASGEMSQIQRKEQLSRVQFLITKELPLIPLYFSTTVQTSKINLVSVRPVSVGRAFITYNSFNWYWR